MSAARDRLKTGYYNNRELVAGTNPGGMARNGHRTNFVLALKDVGDVAQELSDENDALLAAIIADNDATQAAIIADNAATVAAVDADATAANASKNAAGASETAAGTAATTASNAATDAKRTVANNFPDRLDATGSWFTETLAGDPGTIASPTQSLVVAISGYGYGYRRANAQGTLYTKGALSASSGKIYEVEAEVEWTVKGGAETPAFAVGMQGLTSAFATTGTAVQSALTPIGATGVFTLKVRFGYAAPSGGLAWPQPGTSVWLRPFVLINRKSDNSGAVTASTAQVRRLTVRDVTAVVAAEIKAAEAAASAASVAIASSADAIAGAGPGLMTPGLTAEAIAAQSIPIGGMIKANSSPGAKFLLCDGSSYLKATYPVLAALLGDRFASFTVTSPTVKGGYQFRGVYAEATLAIVAGTIGNIQTSTDLSTWTERAASLTNFNETTGVLKLAAKYYVYGIPASAVLRCLVSSANGTTGWADVTAFGTFNNGQAGIASMAYGVLNSVATVVAVGGANGTNAQIKFSTDEGANWTVAGAWTASAVADQYSPQVHINNGVLAVWCPNPATFKRGTTVAGLANVTGPAAAPAQVAVGNGLFVCVNSDGSVYTSPDLLTFTLRDPPPGTEGVAAYLGYVNGAHHFSVIAAGITRVYATPDFASWYRVNMGQAVATATRPFAAMGSKLIAPNSAISVITMASFTHNPSTEFPVPNTPGDLPSFIKGA